jgi:Phosphoglycerol transferase and related proteins, alkaline phosphatase superfamily
MNGMNKERYGIPDGKREEEFGEVNESVDFNTTNEDYNIPDAEYYINTEKMNIDTMRNENEDKDFFSMNIGNDKKTTPIKNPLPGKPNQKDTIPKDTNRSLFQKGLHQIYQSFGTAWNGYVDISGSNLAYPILFIIGTLLYLEITFHILIYQMIDLKIIYPLLFAIPMGLLLGFLTGLFGPLLNKILFFVITGFNCFIFSVQLVYYSIFKVYFSFQSMGMAGDAISNFGSNAAVAVKANAIGILLLFFPLLFAVLLSKVFDFSRRKWKIQGILLGTTVVFHIVAVAALLLFGRGDYSPYDLYHKSKIQDLCGKDLGITLMTRIDITRLFTGKNDLVLDDSIEIQPAVKVRGKTAKAPAAPRISGAAVAQGTSKDTSALAPQDTSPNIMNIDFNAMVENESNTAFRTLDNYFASVTPTDKNKYTGMFRGYNLILITAEGFSPFAVRQDKTPTLYKLTHEGFIFNNFYTPLWQTSTSDGEYVALTGLIPCGTRSMYRGRKNLWPLVLGNQFDKLGVASKAYHDHTYTYYQRNETHPNLGYIFKAKGNGLKLEHPDTWPESDLEMINSTIDEYVKEKQFHVYYLTVSGHMNYSFGGNYLSRKNKALVEDLPYSDDVKAYIACQIELDKALEQLIKKLEEAGVADRTVIALGADHYPYAWDKSIIDEAAGHRVDPYFEIYRNKFILWCEGMKNNIEIDKPCSSLDILPTLSNLFGLDYDSRLLMGQDILSDTSPLVILSNRSFITDKVKYNAATGEATILTKEPIPEDYISNMNKIVKNKFNVSQSILKLDYYRHIFGGQ